MSRSWLPICILVAELIVLPRACVLHGFGDRDGLRARLAGDAQKKDGGTSKRREKTPSRSPLFCAPMGELTEAAKLVNFFGTGYSCRCHKR